MNRPTLVIFISAVAALAALNVYQFVDRQALRDKLSRSEAEGAADSTGGAPAVTGAGRGAGSSASARRPSAKSGSTRRVASSGGGEEGASGKEAGLNDVAKQWAKMLDSPVVQKQMAAQMEAQLGPALAALYQQLGLEGEDLSHFKGLLAEQWMAQQQVGMKLMTAVGDPDKTAEIKTELKEAREEVEGRIREFLNDDQDFEVFQDYQKQLPDRIELEQYNASFEAEGVALTDDQQARLLEAMSEERVASELGDLNDPQGWDFANFNEDTITEVVATMADFHERVRVRAGGYLDNRQLEVLATSQEQSRDLQEMNMTMGLQFVKTALEQGDE